jgi:eukaryotic-like serine/threonine-protein kinase
MSQLTTLVEQSEGQLVSAARTMVWPTNGENISSDATGTLYHVGKFLGEGHFGKVWSATDCWGNNLAIKVLKPERGTYDEVQESALREITNLLTLRSPYVTHVHDAFVYRDAFYIVTEQCDHTLGDALSNKWIGGVDCVIPIARSLLQGIQYIHSQEMVHKDLHLGNVMVARVQSDVGRDWVLKFKIADVGISNLAEKVDPVNTMIAGVIAPPEILDPLQFGPLIAKRIDQYHLGLLFLQVCRGQQLDFSKDEVVNGAPRKLAEKISGPIGSAIARALRRHPAARFMNPRDMWLALNGHTVD